MVLRQLECFNVWFLSATYDGYRGYFPVQTQALNYNLRVQ